MAQPFNKVDIRPVRGQRCSIYQSPKDVLAIVYVHVVVGNHDDFATPGLEDGEEGIGHPGWMSLEPLFYGDHYPSSGEAGPKVNAPFDPNGFKLVKCEAAPEGIGYRH